MAKQSKKEQKKKAGMPLETSGDMLGVMGLSEMPPGFLDEFPTDVPPEFASDFGPDFVTEVPQELPPEAAEALAMASVSSSACMALSGAVPAGFDAQDGFAPGFGTWFEDGFPVGSDLPADYDERIESSVKVPGEDEKNDAVEGCVSNNSDETLLTPTRSNASNGAGGVSGKPQNSFELLEDPLRGRTLIEASAGTGKTYSLEHIVLRLVVERGIAVGRMLIVTFTKAATAELRNRIRGKLLAVRDLVLEERVPDDENLTEQFERWSSLSPDDVRERLERAVREFDDASILTIHSFCQKTLGDFVFTSGGTYGVTSGNTNELADRTVEAFLRLEARKVQATGRGEAAFRALLRAPLRKALENLAREPESARGRAVFSREAGEPEDLDAVELSHFRAMLERFLAWAPGYYDNLKREAAYQTFDDMLVRTEARLAADPGFAQSVRSRYDVVLIDEFQDTDPLQYGIFRTLFGDDALGKTVFFVGDPKQAIYSFRGADFETYRKAVREIPRRRILAKNFRTTPVLMSFFNAFFGRSGTFHDPDIGYDEVAYSEKKTPVIVVDAPVGAKGGASNGETTGTATFRPLPAVVVRRCEVNALEEKSKDALARYEAEAIADEIRTRLAERRRTFVKGRTLRPSDIAILVRSRPHAEAIYASLTARGIRVRLPSEEDVFATEEAKEIYAVLEAIAAPSDRRALEAARATRIFGDDLTTFADEAKRTERLILVRERMEACAERARAAGLTAAFTALFRECGVEKRLLPLAGGDRALANYRHILELLYAAQQTTKTLSGLVRRFRKTLSQVWDAVEKAKNLSGEGEGSKLDVPDERKLRPDANDDRVLINTIHASKGLEYPIVYLPLCWYGIARGSHKLKEFHEADGAGGRRLVLFPTPVKPDLFPDLADAELEEEIRLLYVAMTRASSQLTIFDFVRWNKTPGLNFRFASAFHYALALGDLAGWTKARHDEAWEKVREPFEALRDEFARIWNEQATEFAAAHPGWTPAAETLSPQTGDTGCYWSVTDWMPEDLPVMPLHDTKEAAALPELGATRSVRPTWTQTSYTAIKKALSRWEAEEALLGSGSEDVRETLSGEDEALEEEDETAEGGALGPNRSGRRDVRTRDGSPMARWRAGAALGITIHRLFEVVDFENFAPERVLPTEEELSDPTLTEDLRKARLRQRNWLLSILGGTPDLIRAGEGRNDDPPAEGGLSEEASLRLSELRALMTSVLTTEVLPGFPLQALSRSARQSEYDFLFSIRPDLSQEDFERAVESLGWAGLAPEELTGYLTGSIDLLFAHEGKIWILDWKTDNLVTSSAVKELVGADAPWGDCYAPEALCAHMAAAHYDLQYLCYLAAVKRLLAVRWGETNVDDHIGGAIYFFVRGASVGRGVAVVPYDSVRERVERLEKLLGEAR